jgi:RHS repeat-associated protein
VAAIEYDYSLGGRLGAQSFGTLLASGGLLAFTASASPPMTDEYNYDYCCDCPEGTSLDYWNSDFAMHSSDNYNDDGALGSTTGPQGRTMSNDYGPYSTSPVRVQMYASSSGASAALVVSTPGVNESLYLYNARGELVAMRDGSGMLTRYEYDERGRLILTVTGQGSGTEIRYDDAGQLVASVDGEGRAAHYQYDDAGRLVAEREPAHEAPTTYQYDSAGNLRKVTDPLGHAREYEYDERFRLTEIIDENDDSTTFTYYADNQLHTLTDANLNTTTWTYDGAGRVHTETNELGYAETYFYDEFYRLVEVVDRNGRIAQYDYNGRTLELERWIESGATVREFSYFYRESPQPNGGTSGQVRLIIDTGADFISAADDLRHNYGYDDQGRLEFSETWLGGLNVAVESRRGFDLADRLTGTEFSLDASPEYSYASQDGAVDHENAYAYDSASRVAMLTQTGPFANPKRVELGYNRAGQVAAIDRYAAATPTSPVASTQYQYDEHGRLFRIDHAGTAAGSTFAEEHVYGYDGAGRLASYVNSLGLPYAADYVYDNRGQLIGETGYGSTTYQYDDNGNRTFAENPWLQEYSHFTIGANNRLMEEWGYENEPTPDYTYDNEGNRTSRFIDLDDSDQWDANETGVQYTWDHRNRLTRVTYKTGPTAPATKTIDYAYDAFNQLAKRVEDPDGATGSAAVDQTFYVYEQGQVALEFHQTGSGNLDANDLSHRYLWGPVVDQLLADEQVNWSDGDADGETLWAVGDHLSSVRDVVDSNGDLRIHRAFDAFGHIEDEAHYDAAGQLVTAGQAGYVDTSFAFTGRQFDPATGLQNNLNRWYDPSIGRWLSEDPISFAAGDANLYRYVHGDPVNAVDPTGLEYRPSTRPRPIHPWVPGTRPIDQDERTKEKVEEIKKRLKDAGVGPKTWVGVTPDGNIIAPKHNGDPEELGHYSDFENCESAPQPPSVQPLVPPAVPQKGWFKFNPPSKWRPIREWPGRMLRLPLMIMPFFGEPDEEHSHDPFDPVVA